VSSHKEEGDLGDLEDVPQQTVVAVDIRARHTAISAEEISRKFGVGLETAQKTLKATTQYGICHAVHPYVLLCTGKQWQCDIADKCATCDQTGDDAG
jgi:hypothetical protein